MDKLRTIVFVVLTAVLLAVLGLVYFPSLYHVARSDQLSYLSALGLTHDWYSLAVSTIDLNRKSWFPGGDAALFRPVLYFLLGNERYFFEYDYWYWQLTGVLLHIIACGLLFRVLWRIRPGIGAVCSAAFFAFQFSNLEAVIWHHINGYILFAVFILAALDHFVKWTRDKVITDKVIPMNIFLTLACLTYEGGVWYCLCFAFVMRCRQLLLPVGIYTVLNLANIVCHPDMVSSVFLGKGVAGAHFWQSWFLTIQWFLCAGLFLRSEDIIFAPRLGLRPDFIMPPGGLNGGSLLVVVLSAAVGFVFWQRRHQLKEYLQLQTLLILMLAGYVMIIVCGRVMSRGVHDGLGNTLYYLYNFWILAVVAVYALAQSFKRGKALLLAGMIVLTVFNAQNIYRMNTFMARAFVPERGFVVYLRDFIRSHRTEKDFSFTVAQHCPGHYYQMIPSRDGRGLKKFTFAQLLYPQYYKEIDAKYVIGE